MDFPNQIWEQQAPGRYIYASWITMVGVVFVHVEAKREFIIRVGYLAVWAVIVIGMIKYGLPLLTPFLIAFLIATVVQKPTGVLSKKLKCNHKPIALVLVLGVYGIVGGVSSLIGIRAIAGCKKLLDHLPQIYTAYIEPMLLRIFESIEHSLTLADVSASQGLEALKQQFLGAAGGLVSNLSIGAVEQLSVWATSLPGFLIRMLLMIIASFFMAADYKTITNFCLSQLNKKTKTICVQIKDYVANTLLVCLRSYLLIMAITFVELTIGLWIIGIEHFMVAAGFIAVLDVLPVLGTGTVLIPWSILSVMQGEYAQALGLFAVYLIITIIRNILEPKIVGKQIGLHPVLTLMSMFVGVQVLGVFGLFGLPVGLSLLKYLNDMGTIHILKSETEQAQFD